MTDSELDDCYGELCRRLTEQGEPRAKMVLARFALLAMNEIADAPRVIALIASAAQATDVPMSEPPPP